jgi:hypothetical protein
VNDEYLIAYRDRSAAFEPRLRARVDIEDRALWWHFLVADGRVIGGWSVAPENGTLTIRPRLLRTAAAREKLALRKAARRYAAFAGADVAIEFA